jgi:hypothetical protein
VYATNQLGAMLGCSARHVASMDLAAIIPPPYSQMHAGFMKVGDRSFRRVWDWQRHPGLQVSVYRRKGQTMA